jgi:cell division protein FtsI/penicillin-binding protein 2
LTAAAALALIWAVSAGSGFNPGARLLSVFRPSALSASAQPEVEVRPAASAEAESGQAAVLLKKDLAGLIGAGPLTMDEGRILEISDQDGHLLYVRATLEPALQAKALAWVKASRAYQAALVVMDPDNGEVLALAGYRADGEPSNAALAGSFPAASLFKIVTAAAALESADMSADSKVSYDGGKHTLFKDNVISAPDQGAQAATLKEGFAESINTVFGKLGAFTLGPRELADFAGRFGFNHDIEFELPVEPSSFSVADEADPFNVAELASGFNRETRVSPLHGAMMAAVVISGGRLTEPSLVREVFDRDNHIYYQHQASAPSQAISRETAAELAALMRSTVEDGTGRRTFNTAKTDPVLSKLIIGGKSGTINNEEGARVDWFVAWAAPRQQTPPARRLALSAVVVHGGGAAAASQSLVRDAVKFYFSGQK